MNDVLREEQQMLRFFSRVKKTKNCWEWQGAKDKDGYGIFHARPKHQRAHRYSYELFLSEIPKDKFVCHRCDNPSCVNPKHLWAGTVGDNNRDALAKGRKIPPNLGKTHCKRGHKFTAKNTYIQKEKRNRICRKCRAMKIREWKQKQWKVVK